jgi:TolB-like protein/class 3 adenylate cyclase/Flp pilus assembly protein TadD
MATVRRLAAILATDVVGYSRLMERDEEGTHERVMAHFAEAFEPSIRAHHGRIVKSTGDGMLVEFASVIEAVQCAIEVQCLMSHRNAGISQDECVSFRIGINMGDVIVEPNDIYGDGVNVAARLEALAEANGICVSEVVHEQVRNRLSVAFEDLGERMVKNIARPLRVYGLRPDVIAALPISDTTLSRKPSQSVRSEFEVPAPRLSIVVLPFANFSDDPDQQYLADAITDDVTTDLSRIADMVVISRNTADTYRGRQLNTRQIGRELHVRYVLKGSVRRSQNQIRVNTQLSDAVADSLVWADRFEYTSTDLFRLQDDVTSRIVIALNLEVVAAEARRPTNNPDALDYMLQGRASLYHREGSTPDRFADAIMCFQLALRLDPTSADTRALLGLALVTRVLEQISESPTEDSELAERLIEQALTVSPRQAVAHFAKGHLMRVRGNYDGAVSEYEAALALNRNWVVAIAALGICKFFAGSIEETIPAQELAIRLSPRDPRLPNWYWRIGMVHLMLSRTEPAIAWLEKARTANPTLPGPHAWLASAYALSGNNERATAELAEARRLSPDHRYESIARFEESQSFGSAKTRALARATFYVGLRKAGVPER